MCESENPVIDLGEHYPKQTERNRANILSANGAQRLSVPVIKPFGNKTSTNHVEISYVEAWQRDHCRAIEAAYASSPYFEHYSPEIFDLIHLKSKTLHNLNENILCKLIEWLELPISINISKVYLEGEIKEYRNFNFDYPQNQYKQVEFGQDQFVGNLSILDALFCLGPISRKLIIR